MTLFIGLLILGYYYREDLAYFYMQGKGQMRVLTQSISIEDALKSPALKSHQKENLQLIQQIKFFARDSLGLETADSYQKVYLQNNKAILWTLSACPEFSLTPHQWYFPIVGEVGYKGFFILSKANEERDALISQGYDTRISEVSAWSTLGWFSDPILSNNLNLAKGEFVRLILHEMTHATLYIESDDVFNENLATYVGNNGALQFCNLFLDSAETLRLDKRLRDIKKYELMMLWGSHHLDSTFKHIENLDTSEKRAIKDKGIHFIIDSLKAINFEQPQKFRFISDASEKWNNCYFSDFLMYYAQQDSIDALCNGKFGGSIKKMINEWK